MSSKPAVLARSLAKQYRIYKTPQDRLAEIFFGWRRHQTHQALHPVDLQIQPGETVAVLGRNGAGKSTFLQLVAGTLTPSSGTVETSVRPVSLLELGTGFDPLMSGRENARLYSRILGSEPEETDGKLELICRFAELDAFIDRPLRTYSSGMRLRLAFATAFHLDPQILITDELLAVGDASFQIKCMRRVEQMKEQGKTFIVATHNLNLVHSFCTRALVLDAGRVVFDGPPLEAARAYHALLFAHNSPAASVKTDPKKPLAPSASRSEVRTGNLDAEIVELFMVGQDDKPRKIFKTGESAAVALTVRARRLIPDAAFGFRVRTPKGFHVYGADTRRLQAAVPVLEPEKTYRFLFRFEAHLSGEYFLTAGIFLFDKGEKLMLDHRLDALSFTVLSPSQDGGVADLHSRFETQGLPEPD